MYYTEQLYMGLTRLQIQGLETSYGLMGKKIILCFEKRKGVTNCCGKFLVLLRYPLATVGHQLDRTALLRCVVVLIEESNQRKLSTNIKFRSKKVLFLIT